MAQQYRKFYANVDRIYNKKTLEVYGQQQLEILANDA